MAYDANLLLRTVAEVNLTATETSRAGVDFGAGDVRPLTYIIVTPKATGTTPTNDTVIQDSADNSTWKPFLTFDQITTKGSFYRTGVSPRRYRRASITITGTTPNFGLTQIGVDIKGDYDRQ